MNIEKNYIDKVLNISILGDIQRRNDIEVLRSELKNINENVVLTFFDAKTLPSVIIEELINLQNKKNNIKVKIIHPALSSYLYRLGIDHILLDNKSLNKKNKRKIKAIVIGGSAGSLEHILNIVKNLTKQDIAVFIVQHILEKSTNYLASILQNKTPYQVKDAENDELIQNGYIYIAPPAHQMKIINGRIVLTKEPPMYFARPSIDVLFESASKEYKSGLIAVLLSGYNDDGSHSLELLRINKSIVLVQDPEECNEKELLLNAIKTKNYNYIFPLPELIHYLKRLIEPKQIEIDKDRIKIFLKDIHEKYGYDYRQYSVESIYRLIQKEMEEQGYESFEDFSGQVLQWPDAFEALFLEFSINVTEFFRNPNVFNKIRNNIFPYLSSYPHIKIWCAGCSTGEEPYSLAIILKELNLLDKAQIYATDINPFIIEQAKNGIFSEINIEKDLKNYNDAGGSYQFKSYFDKVGNNLKVKDEIKDKIVFFEHSLVNQGVLNEFNLILCRNVIIYFDDKLQESVMNLFSNSLGHNGFLILGETEFIKNTSLFSSFDKNLKIFKKTY